MRIKGTEKRIIAYSAAGMVIFTSAACLSVMGQLNRTIDERLQRTMAERVIWKCESCSGPQLVPVTGRDYQPRNWTRLDQLPPKLVDAVIAVEDKRFYSHPGVDLYRLCGAVVKALRKGESPRGTSTLTQQVARTLFTSRERTIKRKVREMFFAFALERRLSKGEILELYLNTVPFGNAGPYEVVGVADAFRAFLNLRLGEETDPASIALITGMIQRPSYLNPATHPKAVEQRRNLVLHLMRLHGVISAEEEQEARKAPVEMANLETDSAHYLQLAARELSTVVTDAKHPLEVHLTLDAALQQVAVKAMEAGLAKLNRRLAKRGAKVEGSLVAIDPRTGAVRALVGGSNFLRSQVNRALSLRQPGSVFKPFVYAAAFEYGTPTGAFGPYSHVNDIPRKFSFNGKLYQPSNYGNTYNGRVTLQDALAHSLNIPAVRLAEAVGYQQVAQLARAAGLDGIGPTPSAALGSYEVSPLGLAGAYTIFANQGIAVRPYFVERAYSWKGSSVYRNPVRGVRVMRVDTAQVLAKMLRNVVRYGTAHRASRLPFAVAGKTGTDDDGWFVGFTDRLLCAVWIGYDDNRDLGLEGAQSALPIWMDFVQEASKLKRYQFGKELPGPEARMYGAMRDVDPPLPVEELDQWITEAVARLASGGEDRAP